MTFGEGQNVQKVYSFRAAHILNVETVHFMWRVKSKLQDLWEDHGSVSPIPLGSSGDSFRATSKEPTDNKYKRGARYPYPAI